MGPERRGSHRTQEAAECIRVWGLGPACLGSNPAQPCVSGVPLGKFLSNRIGTRGARPVFQAPGSVVCASYLILTAPREVHHPIFLGRK